MSRIFEALQKSSRAAAAGFSDFASVLQENRQAEADITDAPSGEEQLQHFPSLKTSIPNDRRIWCLTDQDSLGAEKFRFLGVKLRHLQQSRKLKKVIITSTIPEEGKSTISANLAATLARKPQHKVLLLDGDLRRPTLHHSFGVKPPGGLSEWLQGDGSGPEPIYRLADAGFWFMPAGTPIENPLDLLQSARLGALMERLAGWFDWILIDTPPVLPLADTSVWSRVGDGTLLVAREGKTEKKQLKRGLEALKNSDLIGVVLNSCANPGQKDYYQRYAIGAN